MNEISLYIHIPFCKSKCNYCDFFSKSIDCSFNFFQDEYVNALCNEISFYFYNSNCTKDENKKTIRKVILGVILFISPFLPFLVLETSYIAMRNMYLPFLGFAIILEVFADLILKIIKNEKVCNIIKTSICGFLVIVFVISNIDGRSFMSFLLSGFIEASSLFILRFELL